MIYVLIIVFASSCSCASIKQRARIEGTISQAEQYISEGEYKKALDVYAAAYALYRSSELRKKYLEAGNHIGNAADHAFQKNEFVKGGSIYSLLIESRIAEQDFSRSLLFNADYLRRQKKACSRTLTEMGLMKYREEKLDEAISIWEKVLAFDRDHSVIKAVDTAGRQLRNLKNLDNPRRP